MAERKSTPPLLIEPHPPEYKGFPFITLIQFKKDHILCIVDNADKNNISAYVLDLCGACGVNEEELIVIANDWFVSQRKYPLGIELAKRGLTKYTELIYKTFPTEYVSRVIGPLPSYPMNEVIKVRRRRKKQISPTIQIHHNVIKLF